MCELREEVGHPRRRNGPKRCGVRVERFAILAASGARPPAIVCSWAAVVVLVIRTSRCQVVRGWPGRRGFQSSSTASGAVCPASA
ncbi:hypothetical protein [Methylobacterium nigriterrae]|uniref:hypothetical protein n=1 Tax=Methylobacterium nigriterrae TaxID=3127512 RepID=UPI0030136C8A